MSVKSFTRLMTMAVAVGFVLACPGRADRKQLQAKLNKNLSIELEDVTIVEALETIGQKAELKIALSDEAVWKLPEGEMTRLSVTLQGRLGDSMTEMLNAFFMRYAVGDEQITIYPRPELEHIIGRPGTGQLELLKKIYTMRIEFAQGISEEAVSSLIGKSMGVSFLPYDAPNRMYEILKASESDKGTAPTTLAILFEQIGDRQKIPCWYIYNTGLPNEIPMIKMVSKEDFLQEKLGQIIDISFVDERADVILRRLAGWAGMVLTTITNEPSWLEKKIDVKMQDVTLRQALQSIIQTMDGTYEFVTRNNSVHVKGPIHRKKTTASRKPQEKTAADDGYVGKISIPMDGGKYFLEFMLRENDLPEELKKFREEKIKEVIEKTASERRRKLIEALKKAKESAPTQQK